MKILHLSDLHICAQELDRRLREVANEAQHLLGNSFHFSVASEDQLNRLASAVEAEDPDLICVTGDITTFGDATSFDKAREFLTRLRRRNGGPLRPIYVVPGNHDVLACQLQHLLNTIDQKFSEARELGLSSQNFLMKRFVVPALLRGGRWAVMRLPLVQKVFKLRDKLDAILMLEGVEVLPDDPLKHYRDLVDNFDQQSDPHNGFFGPINGNGETDVIVVPFSSVSLDSLWLNIGVDSQSDFEGFRRSLQSARQASDPARTVIIALLHHNPMNAPGVEQPRIVAAYNTMPGASNFLREMQTSGVDLVLFGHQHQQFSAELDFLTPAEGQIYIVGAPSSTCGHAPGANRLEVKSRYHVTVQGLTLDQGGAGHFRPSPEHELVLEDARSDARTSLVRAQIRKVVRGTLPEDMELSSGAKELFLIGPRLRRLTEERHTTVLRKILNDPHCESVKILLSDPELFAAVESADGDAQKRLVRMWDQDAEFSWDNQAREAKAALNALSKLHTSLLPVAAAKLSVKLSHTLMPIGATVRDLNNRSAWMVVEVLPVGLFSTLHGDRPCLRITKRDHEGLFQFYADYIRGLWDAARPYEWGSTSAMGTHSA